MSVRLLLAVDRRVSVSQAEEVVMLADRLRQETGGVVVGIDLSGDPNVSLLIFIIYPMLLCTCISPCISLPFYDQN